MKSYIIKIYNVSGDFIATKKDFSFTGFRKQINSGVGEFVFVLPNKFDDFSENYEIALNNKVELWVQDDDTGSDGVRMYSGYISSYNPRIVGNKENVEVKCLGYVSKLATSILKNGTQIELKTSSATGLTTGDTASATPISDIVAAIVDRYQDEAVNPIVNYSDTSIDTISDTMTYTFNAKYYDEAIDLCRQYAPSGTFWYVDSSNIINFKTKPTTATHTFVLGKDFSQIQTAKNMEDVVNRVLFTSSNDVVTIMKLYSDSDSSDLYDDRWAVISDSRVQVEDTADLVGNSTLDSKKDPIINTKVEIIDNNGANSGYDIESIEPGHTCKFVGFDPITSQTFNDNMMIVSVEYTPDSVVIEVEQLADSIARRTIQSERKIVDQDSPNRPKSYDTTTSGWTVYTPTWTGSLSNPAIGDGKIEGRFFKQGSLIIYNGLINVGSTTTFGSGDWRISLPVACANNDPNVAIGSLYLLDAGTRNYTGITYMFGTNAFYMINDNSTGAVGPTIPFTWATNDLIRWTIVYEAAV
jgi:hypothetical protein